MATRRSNNALELDDEAESKRIFWKDESSERHAALKLNAARHDAERAEWRADRESWEAERHELQERIATLQMHRYTLTGWVFAVTCMGILAIAFACYKIEPERHVERAAEASIVRGANR